MATLQSKLQEVQELLRTVGRSGLNRLYPNDFEYYAIAFEVVNSKFETQAYLLFPIMPDSMTKSENNPITVEKTMSGVHSIVNPTFVPYDTTLIGTFGSKLRVVSTTSNGSDNIGVFGKLSKSTYKNFIKNAKGALQGKELKFSDIFKTGYGVCKALEAMSALSATLDEYGKPHIAIMYDLSFNDITIVEILAYNFSQDIGSNNGFYRYNLAVKHVAPLLSINSDKRKTIRKTLKRDVLGKTIKTFAKSLTKYTIVDLS